METFNEAQRRAIAAIVREELNARRRAEQRACNHDRVGTMIEGVTYCDSCGKNLDE